MSELEADWSQSGVTSLEVTSIVAGHASQKIDGLIAEVPVAIVINGISHAVMMASPTDLDDFALGFCLSEGILQSPNELYGIDVKAGELGIEILLEVAAACEWRLKERKRSMTGRTGCGLCGSESLHQVQRRLKNVPALNVRNEIVFQAVAQLQKNQNLQSQTGASHAAAWFDFNGQIVVCREDVGRHNALDKLIGYLIKHEIDPSAGFICITSRASFEMVQKTIQFGASVLAAISAPTGLAVQIARTHNLCLLGFVREPRLVAYSFPERVQVSS